MDSGDLERTGRESAPTSIAIVGCGPKGLYALDSLCTLVGMERDPPGLDVTIYEPTGRPGAGAIYDPSQPAFLRMNFASRYIDAWDRTLARPSPRRHSLVDWLRVHRPAEADPDGFVSRATVGQYLTDCLVEILADRPPSIRIRFRFELVDRIGRQGDRWRVHAPGDAVDFDEVLIATGHQDWQRRSRTSDLTPGSTSIPSIFPVTSQLGMAAIPAGSVIGFKGFALTWIDAVLALTVGRGGAFAQRDGIPRYTASGKEPARLIPLSRTGRPLLCKPDYRRFSSPAPEGLWQERSTAIPASPEPAGSICFRTTIWPEILRGADQALGVAGGTAEAWFEAWRAEPHDGVKACQEMRSSYRVATGQAPPDIAWALGEAWRQTYPALVACVSHGGLSEASWPEFTAIAKEMERVAFGSPAINMGCMLALIEAGLVDLRHVSHCADDSTDRWPADIEIMIDATIPPPPLFDSAGPIHSLLQVGHLTRGPGGGILIDANGQALAGGAPVPGLSVLGRPTEGSVLGNDTLSRVLHRHPVNWARRILHRAAAALPHGDACLAATA